MTIREDQVLAVARRVIDRTDRDHPADGVLRQTLREEHSLSREESARVSEYVFAFFRWRAWPNAGEDLPARISAAVGLAEVFQHEPGSFPPEELCEKTVPEWIRQELEVTPAWAEALQHVPKLWLRARRGKGGALSQILQDTLPAGSGGLADSLHYFGGQDLFRTPEFRDGMFELQDLSSQMVGLVCEPCPGETWWDACAGEGGKALHLSELMENRGLLWVSDRAAWRLQKLKHRAARAKMFNYRAAPWDGSARLPTKTGFDGVLVDAPCSGVGTWHRNPHARWTTSLNDVRELAQVQLRLLNHAVKGIKPGGKLIYSVCTLTRSETAGVVEEFEKLHGELVPMAITDPLAPGRGPQKTITYRTEECGGNGMFIAAWRRTGSA